MAVVESALSVVASWVVASYCIPHVAAAALVVVASVDSIYCFLSVVYGVVVTMFVQNPLALSCDFLLGSRPSFLSCSVGVVHA